MKYKTNSHGGIIELRIYSADLKKVWLVLLVLLIMVRFSSGYFYGPPPVRSRPSAPAIKKMKPAARCELGNSMYDHSNDIPECEGCFQEDWCEKHICPSYGFFSGADCEENDETCIVQKVYAYDCSWHRKPPFEMEQWFHCMCTCCNECRRKYNGGAFGFWNFYGGFRGKRAISLPQDEP